MCAKWLSILKIWTREALVDIICYKMVVKIKDSMGECMKKIIAVVVTYNRCDLLQKCLDSLLRQTYPCEILVVDNASKDNTMDVLKKIADPRVQTLRLEKNMGGAGGFYAGMKQAVEVGCDCIWIMDDDTLPEPDALEQLMCADESLSGEDYGFLSSAVQWTDGTACRMNSQKLLKPYYRQLHRLKEGMILVEYASFVSLLFRRETVLRAGLPIKEYFIWGDDIEYTTRLTSVLQMDSYLVGKSLVTHAMQTNTGSNIAKDTVDRLPRYAYAFRNEACTARRRGAYEVFRYFGRCGKLFFMILFQASGHRLRRLRYLFSGMLRGCFFHPKIEYIENGEKKNTGEENVDTAGTQFKKERK